MLYIDFSSRFNLLVTLPIGKELYLCIYMLLSETFRAVLQFTPETWTANKWLDPNSSFMRVVAVAFLVIMFQVFHLVVIR